MASRSDARSPQENGGVLRYTVVALFEDTIDAEQALVSLRKAEHDAERVSLLVRDNTAEESGGDRASAVARALVATALDAAGTWLQGLASLIVPEHGTFLVAGPIGAALAGIGASEASSNTSYAAATDLSAGGLLRTLTDFGFSSDEATYMEHRLEAGAALLAVTTTGEATPQSTRRLFADHNAVYIGTAQTDAIFFQEAEALLEAPPEASSGGDVVVTDAVAPLRKLSQDGGSPRAAARRQREVVDSQGEEVGRVEEVLAESTPESTAANAGGGGEVIRYLVIGFGGVLGIGRRHIAVPASLIDLQQDPLQLSLDKHSLLHAPSYEEDGAFSRLEEQAVWDHFGIPPYWQET